MPAEPIAAPGPVRAWLRHNRFLLVFAVLASLMGTSVGVAKIAVSLYALDLGASAAQLGLIASGQMAGTLVMAVPIGFLVEHYGPGRLFVLGSALAGLAYALVPAVPSAAFLLGCVTAISFFMPLRFVSLNAVFFEQIRTLGEGKAGWYRGTHMSGMFLVGPALAVGLIAALGYAGTFWALAASFVLTIAVSPIVFARYSRPRAAAGRRPGLRAIVAELGVLARERELRQLCLIDLAASAATMYQSTFIVAIALQVMGLDAAHASAYVTGTGLTFILTLFFGGALVRRIGVRGSYLAGFALSALALAFQGAAPGPAWLWPGVLLQGLGLGLLQIVTLTRIARIGARLGQGKVSGVNLLVRPVGSLVGSALGGLLGQQIGLQNVFFVLLPVFVLLSVWQLRGGGEESDAASAAQAPAAGLEDGARTS